MLTMRSWARTDFRSSSLRTADIGVEVERCADGATMLDEEAAG
jgi:hypothetical protein